LLHFGVFDVDPEARELRKRGIRVRLPHQAFQVLQVLIENPGRVISRDELRRALWPAETFVEFDHGLNNAISRLRDLLDDSSSSPRFIETIPRRGYRFIASVESRGQRDAGPLETVPTQVAPAAAPPLAPLSAPAVGASAARPVRWWPAAIGVGLVVLLGVSLAYRLSGSQLTQAKSLAVLPFAYESGADQSDQAYLADGMTDALITQLSKLGALRVISETSSRRYKDATKSLPAIARDLGVDTIVQGSVFRTGDVIRVNVQLIRADTDTNLWAQSYTRSLGNIAALESEVALDVANEIGARITLQERTRVSAARPVDPEAYRLYVLGNQLRQKETKAEFYEALDTFQRALEIEPAYARAYWGIAETWIGLASWAGFIPPRAGFPKAKAAVQRALAIDPALAEAHAALGFVSEAFDWDFTAAEQSYKLALNLSPNNADTHWRYTLFLYRTGRRAEGIAQAELAYQLNPLSLAYNVSLGTRLSSEGRLDQAFAALRRATELDPTYYDAWLHLGEAYEFAGRPADAVANAQHGVEISNSAPHAVVGLAEIYARLGKRSEAQALLTPLEKSVFHGDAYGIASAHLMLGDKDAALRWFLTACEERAPRMAYFRFEEENKRYDPIRGDARFKEFLRCAEHSATN
jgi:TolB-like protein/DNA-binding winged helix-turn-helix (wHTH) protein/Tfp pilus assembly protein PilF